MRKIKFRSFIERLKLMTMVTDIDFDNAEITAYYFNDYHFIKIGDINLMQYTGLRDKNGIEIYEGDILELINEDGERIKCVVEFGNRILTTEHGAIIDIQCFYFKIGDRKTNPVANNYCGKHDLKIIEVMGNIYENPELLGVN